MIFCEAVAIYGVIVAIILATKVEDVDMANKENLSKNMHAGFAYFGAGLTTGFSNLVCGYVGLEMIKQTIPKVSHGL